MLSDLFQQIMVHLFCRSAFDQIVINISFDLAVVLSCSGICSDSLLVLPNQDLTGIKRIICIQPRYRNRLSFFVSIEQDGHDTDPSGIRKHQKVFAICSIIRQISVLGNIKLGSRLYTVNPFFLFCVGIYQHQMTAHFVPDLYQIDCCTSVRVIMETIIVLLYIHVVSSVRSKILCTDLASAFFSYTRIPCKCLHHPCEKENG